MGRGRAGMVMRLREALAGQEFFTGLDSQLLDSLAGCAQLQEFAPGQELLAVDEPAETFYLLLSGSVCLSVPLPGGSDLTIETLGAGQMLGWSWLSPPYRCQFDARAMERGWAIGFYAGCLRQRMESNPALGFALMARFVPVISERLHATRLRILELGEAAA